MAEERNQYQITRKDAKNCFVESCRTHTDNAHSLFSLAQLFLYAEGSSRSKKETKRHGGCVIRQ